VRAPKSQIWSIGIYTGSTPLSLHPEPRIRNPVLIGPSITDVSAAYIADPFMTRIAGSWYMFFEVLNRKSGRGEIGLATSVDMKNWTYKHIVLREPFHLSYPYVFEWENNHYIIPESFGARSVRLYRAAAFPSSWEFVGELLTGDDFQDNSIFRFGDRWWLYSEVAPAPYYAGTLKLFFSDRLRGPWREHPQSPVVRDDCHNSRPAGRVLVHNRRIVRFAQSCSPVYGTDVRAFEVEELTESTYRERALGPSPVLNGSGRGWNESGMHHLDLQASDEGWVACVDGWRWSY
jgi:hypothetical protein